MQNFFNPSPEKEIKNEYTTENHLPVSHDSASAQTNKRPYTVFDGEGKIETETDTKKQRFDNSMDLNLPPVEDYENNYGAESQGAAIQIPNEQSPHLSSNQFPQFQYTQPAVVQQPYSQYQYMQPAMVQQQYFQYTHPQNIQQPYFQFQYMQPAMVQQQYFQYTQPQNIQQPYSQYQYNQADMVQQPYFQFQHTQPQNIQSPYSQFQYMQPAMIQQPYPQFQYMYPQNIQQPYFQFQYTQPQNNDLNSQSLLDIPKIEKKAEEDFKVPDFSIKKIPDFSPVSLENQLKVKLALQELEKLPLAPALYINIILQVHNSYQLTYTQTKDKNIYKGNGKNVRDGKKVAELVQKNDVKEIKKQFPKFELQVAEATYLPEYMNDAIIQGVKNNARAGVNFIALQKFRLLKSKPTLILKKILLENYEIYAYWQRANTKTIYILGFKKKDGSYAELTLDSRLHATILKFLKKQEFADQLCCIRDMSRSLCKLLSSHNADLPFRADSKLTYPVIQEAIHSALQNTSVDKELLYDLCEYATTFFESKQQRWSDIENRSVSFIRFLFIFAIELDYEHLLLLLSNQPLRGILEQDPQCLQYALNAEIKKNCLKMSDYLLTIFNFDDSALMESFWLAYKIANSDHLQFFLHSEKINLQEILKTRLKDEENFSKLISIMTDDRYLRVEQQTIQIAFIKTLLNMSIVPFNHQILFDFIEFFRIKSTELLPYKSDIVDNFDKEGSNLLLCFLENPVFNELYYNKPYPAKALFFAIQHDNRALEIVLKKKGLLKKDIWNVECLNLAMDKNGTHILIAMLRHYYSIPTYKNEGCSQYIQNFINAQICIGLALDFLSTNNQLAKKILDYFMEKYSKGKLATLFFAEALKHQLAKPLLELLLFYPSSQDIEFIENLKTLKHPSRKEILKMLIKDPCIFQKLKEEEWKKTITEYNFDSNYLINLQVSLKILGDEIISKNNFKSDDLYSLRVVRNSFETFLKIWLLKIHADDVLLINPLDVWIFMGHLAHECTKALMRTIKDVEFNPKATSLFFSTIKKSNVRPASSQQLTNIDEENNEQNIIEDDNSRRPNL